MIEALLLLPGVPYILVAVLRFFHLLDDWGSTRPPQDCLGQAILWPLFAAKYVVVAIFRAAKELAA
jgi:hypothetical protein